MTFPGLFRSSFARRAGTLLGVLSLGVSAGFGQASSSPSAKSAPHPRSHRHEHAAAVAPAAKAVPPAPVPPPAPATPMDLPAKPATVTLSDGRLTIAADNSSLGDILKQIAQQGGMSIDGLQGESRVFGDYGPGNPRAVLAELLADTGYNFVMLGANASGTPRKLDLMPQSGSASSSAAAARPAFVQPAVPESPIQPAPDANDNTEQQRMQMHLRQLQRMEAPQADEDNPQ